METPRDWHESDAFWEAAEEIMFDPARLATAQTDVESLLKLLGVGPPGACCDLCCGVGRHTAELARLGFEVTPVDRTARYLERAKQAHRAGTVEFILGDAREFVRPGGFDFVINMYTSFGYFESAADDLQVAKNVAESLKRGGRFVIQTQGKEVISQKFVAHDYLERDGILLLQEHHLHANFEAIESRWSILRGGERKEIGFVVRLYAATELRALLRQAGFSSVRFFGALTGEPYDQNASRMVAVATK